MPRHVNCPVGPPLAIILRRQRRVGRLHLNLFRVDLITFSPSSRRWPVDLHRWHRFHWSLDAYTFRRGRGRSSSFDAHLARIRRLGRKAWLAVHTIQFGVPYDVTLVAYDESPPVPLADRKRVQKIGKTVPHQLVYDVPPVVVYRWKYEYSLKARRCIRKRDRSTLIPFPSLVPRKQSHVVLHVFGKQTVLQAHLSVRVHVTRVGE